MKIIQINTCSYGSTGNIATQLCRWVEASGGEAWLCVPNGRHNREKYPGNHIWIGSCWSEDLHLLLSRVTGRNGYFSVLATGVFLKRVLAVKPDLVHLHNLHNSYINLPMLFRFLKKHSIPVVWTLHDCWAFTGHCPHFTVAACDKWKTGCFSCPQYRAYPQSFVDTSRMLYRKKKKWFTGLNTAVVVTPSQWLADLVQKSFLQAYPIRVIHNGIDLNVFRKESGSFRARHHISPEKKIVLGVSFGWSYGKGLDVFQQLAKRLPSEQYQIVLVGTDPGTDRSLNPKILSVHRTRNQQELAEIYAAANVFVNPTREDNFPTVNMEALACGTPVVTFLTGGSPEIADGTCGSVIACGDIVSLEREIVRICDEKPYSEAACLKRAQKFDKQNTFAAYMSLYREILHDRTSDL